MCDRERFILSRARVHVVRVPSVCGGMVGAPCACHVVSRGAHDVRLGAVVRILPCTPILVTGAGFSNRCTVDGAIEWVSSWGFEKLRSWSTWSVQRCAQPSASGVPRARGCFTTFDERSQARRATEVPGVYLRHSRACARYRAGPGVYSINTLSK